MPDILTSKNMRNDWRKDRKLIVKLIRFVGIKQVIKLGLVVLATSVFEVLGVASIASSFGVMGGSGNLVVPTWLQSTTNMFFTGTTELDTHKLLILALVFLTLTMLANLLSSYLVFRAVNFNKSALATRILSKYLAKEYAEFIDLNTDDLGKNLLVEVNRISGGVLFSLLNVASSLIFLIIITSLLAIANLEALISISITMLTIYFVLYFALSRLISNFGLHVTNATSKRFKIAAESFQQIKVVKLNNLEDDIVDQFRAYSDRQAKYQSLANVIKISPRYLVEWFVFCSSILVFLLFFSNVPFEIILPYAALYALAGYKILPSLQKIYTGFMSIKETKWALALIENELDQQDQEPIQTKPKMKLPIKPKIACKDLSLLVGSEKKVLLHGINLEINSGEKVAVVGHSGSGKSSLLNVLSGLLPPSNGTICVDGMRLHKDILTQDWNKIIGYVPQAVNLFDDTILRNITLTFGSDSYDLERLNSSIHLSALDDVINSRKDAILTAVGDNGIKLSGGQIQRLGIARALYKEPKILILDEATSSLDRKTEEKIINRIFSAEPRLTIISVTHRPETLNLYDAIVYMEGGTIRSVKRPPFSIT